MQKEEIIIRDIHLSDLDGAMRLSTEQGWNQTKTDWKLIIENKLNACLLAEYRAEIIGTTAAMNYSNDVAWINMVLVDKRYRGHGISKILLEAILKKLHHSKSIKLDATPEGQKVYKQYHFIDEYSITRMTCDSLKNISQQGDALTKPVQKKDISEIIACDKLAFGADRTALIESLVKTYPHKAWMLKRNNSVAGFVLGREGRKYNQIGPVMASSAADAEILITKLLSDSENKPMVADVLNDKQELISWLSSIGFVEQRHFVRMYQHNNPFPGNIDRQYLICGPEFG
jgi:N-acetylglutamate synthase-like GNAT family acetyltransferase